MKKEIMIFAVFLVPIFCLLMGAFISAEFNLMFWEEISRFLLVLFSSLLFLLTVGFIRENF